MRVEEIYDGPRVEEVEDELRVEEMDGRQQVKIVNPQTDDNNHAAGDSGNIRSTGLNGHNEAKGSEQNREIEPNQRSK